MYVSRMRERYLASLTCLLSFFPSFLPSFLFVVVDVDTLLVVAAALDSSQEEREKQFWEFEVEGVVFPVKE